MNLKTCTCGHKATTKDSKLVGRSNGFPQYLVINCCKCDSSFIILLKKDKEKLDKMIKNKKKE